METQYYKAYSPALGRDMEMKRYGHAGRPVLFVPCQNGRFFDFENFHMTDVWGPWIEGGRCMVYSIDTLDEETWSNGAGDPGWRSWRHEQWMSYIFNEAAPGMLDSPLIKFAYGMTLSDLLVQGPEAKPLYQAVIDALNAEARTEKD